MEADFMDTIEGPLRSRPPADCYAVAEAAKVTGFSDRQIRRLCAQRRLGHVRRHLHPGIRWKVNIFIPRKALLAYMNVYKRFEYVPALPPEQTKAKLPPKSHMSKHGRPIK